MQRKLKFSNKEQFSVFKSLNFSALYSALKNKIHSYFKEGSTISKDRLVEFILKGFPELKKSSITVYLSRLKKDEIIKNPSRGIYALKEKKHLGQCIKTHQHTKASRAILSNLSYRFFGKVNDPDTAKYYERFFEIVKIQPKV